MWKVSFNKDTYKKVEVFNDKATVVTLIAKVVIPKEIANHIPLKVFDWAQKHVNPKIVIIPHYDIIEFKVKGKTVRKDGDENKPLLAERLAECKAKMSIYRFMVAFTVQYAEYYMKIMMGKNSILYPDDDFSTPDRDSIWGANARFGELLDKEYMRRIKLEEEIRK